MAEILHWHFNQILFDIFTDVFFFSKLNSAPPKLIEFNTFGILWPVEKAATHKLDCSGESSIFEIKSAV